MRKDQAKELRENAAALSAWFDSVVANQREASFYGGYSIERAARDALDCAFRLAASAVDAMRQTADALESQGMAARSGETGTGSTEGNSSARKGAPKGGE